MWAPTSHPQRSPGYHTHRHMSPLLIKEVPDVPEGCQSALPSREKTRCQPAPRTWLWTGCGSGTRPIPAGTGDRPWDPLSLFKLSLLFARGDFQHFANSAPVEWKAMGVFFEIHFPELSLLLFPNTRPGGQFATFMISNRHACSPIMKTSTFTTRHFLVCDGPAVGRGETLSRAPRAT